MLKRLSNIVFDTICLAGTTLPAMHDSAVRLYQAAKQLRGVSGQSNVARLLNESPQTVKNWEVRGISDGGAIRAEGVFGCRAYWLTTGEGDMLTSGLDLSPATLRAHEPSRRYQDDVRIQQYDAGGRMGEAGLVLRDQPGLIRSWDVSPEWIQKNVRHHTGVQNLCIVTGFGDSMRPMYNPGDPLLVDRGVKSVDFDGVYFFRVEDEGFIKRLQRIPGQGLIAISENKAYRDWTLGPALEFEVLGRVLKVWRGEDF